MDVQQGSGRYSRVVSNRIKIRQQNSLPVIYSNLEMDSILNGKHQHVMNSLWCYFSISVICDAQG